jgi:hypothetical protein
MKRELGVWEYIWAHDLVALKKPQYKVVKTRCNLAESSKEGYG